MKLANQYKWAGRGTVALGVIVGGLEIYDGYQKDGGKFGYNAQMAFASTAGETIGGLAGAEIGSVVGGILGGLVGGVGAIPGAAMGAVIGGWFGGQAGSSIGEEAINNYYEK